VGCLFHASDGSRFKDRFVESGPWQALQVPGEFIYPDHHVTIGIGTPHSSSDLPVSAHVRMLDTGHISDAG